MDLMVGGGCSGSAGSCLGAGPCWMVAGSVGVDWIDRSQYLAGI